MSKSLVARSPSDRFRDLADAGENTFLTGPAGSGKSFNVRDDLKRHPDTHVTASTGVAALNVGGMTVHRWSGMLLGPAKGQSFEHFFAHLSRDAKPSVRVAFNRVRRCKRLVIDEISMLSGSAFDYLDFHCRRIRENDRPFGGIQVIGTGDFCLEKGTEVVMADGSLRAVELVKVGDEVMGPDSLPRRVIRCFAGQSNLYRVTQANGDNYTVTGNHLLALCRRGNCVKRYPHIGDFTLILAKDMASKSDKFLECFGGYKAGVISLPERHLDLEPYFLGIWLGDGDTDCVRICSPEPEIIEYCHHFALRSGVHCSLRRARNNTPAIRISLTNGRGNGNPVRDRLIQYRVLGDKHIPEDFLLNSEHNRLELLAGLLDTDGCWSGNRFIYCTVLDQLARQVKQLADHLGFRTALRRNSANLAWEISIGGDTWRIPTKVTRKQSHPRSLGRSRLSSTLKVSEAGFGEFAGFETDGDRLFVLADGTVTHNCQLPPVRTNPTQPYDWAFDSSAWSEAGFQTVELRRIMRQDEPDFVAALGKFRRGEIDATTERLLRTRITTFPARDITRLFTHNSMVDRWNDFCLGEIAGPESVREAETWGPQHQIDFLEKNLLTPKVLRLKPGAKVMFTVNRPDDGFVNGQTGEVVSIGFTTVVVFTEGREVEVSPYRWRYDSNDPGTAWFEQLPLRLANALTIHKSQGLTLDSAFIDIRAAREPGQAYVAISRVRTLAGLHLKDWPRGVFVSQRALNFHFPHSLT
jgi:hypothetical protein